VRGHADLGTVLRGVRSALDEATVQVEDICRVVEAVLGGLPGDPGVADLRGARHTVVAELGALSAEAGDPAQLRDTGARWITDVGAPVSRLVAVASDAVLQTDDHWAGVAADAYRATLPAQRTALAAVVAICQEIDATLDELAGAIIAFWIAIGAACLGLVLALAGALGTAATAVGAPAAAGLALAGVGALVAAGNEALTSLTHVSTTAAARSAALCRRTADSTAFPFGTWPRSTVPVRRDAGGWQVR
jgi:hypothetical protein